MSFRISAEREAFKPQLKAEGYGEFTNLDDPSGSHFFRRESLMMES